MDVFDLSARLTVDTAAYDENLDGAGRRALIAGEVMSAAFEDAGRRTAGAADAMVRDLAAAFSVLASDAALWGADLVSSFTAGIESRFQSLRSAAENLAGIVRGYLHFSEPDVGPLSDFHTYAPDMMALFARGIRENGGLVTAELERTLAPVPAGFDFGLAPQAPVSAPARSARTEIAPARDMTVILMLDRAELGRAVYTLNNEETQRVGVRLAGGVL